MSRSLLVTVERTIYSVFVVPLVAFLPARLAYSVACLQGDVIYRFDASTRESIVKNLACLLPNQLGATARSQVARDYFRMLACELIDNFRLAGKGRALSKLVEIRGLEHIETALALGKGAILCSGHFGSALSCFSLVGARGFPVTFIAGIPDGGRRGSRIGRFIHRRIINLEGVEGLPRRHLRRVIDSASTRSNYAAAFQAAKILRNNELVGILIDRSVIRARSGTLPVNFLNGKARFLPGAVTIAKYTEAPILMIFLRRTEDWRHQVLEISPPISMEGDVETAFARCVAALEIAIRRRPSQWQILTDSSGLARMGLLPSR